MWNSLKQQFMKVQNKYIPLRDKKQTINNRSRWYNKEITEAIRQRNKLYKAKKSNINPTTVKSYNDARGVVKKINSESKASVRSEYCAKEQK